MRSAPGVDRDLPVANGCSGAGSPDVTPMRPASLLRQIDLRSQLFVAWIVAQPGNSLDEGRRRLMWRGARPSYNRRSWATR